MTESQAGSDGDLVSYRTLRRVVGLLGVALPVVLAVWGFILRGSVTIQPSISDYYALRTRDALVGVLFTVGWFLFTYHGYDRRDNIAGNFACVFALGVALFPNSGSAWEARVHYACATAMFLVLAYFSLCLFTKSAGYETTEKRTRNGIYRACGIAILISIAAIAVYNAYLKATVLRNYAPVFWLESLALWAFGFSWFVKGETVFKDK